MVKRVRGSVLTRSMRSAFRVFRRVTMEAQRSIRHSSSGLAKIGVAAAKSGGQRKRRVAALGEGMTRGVAGGLQYLLYRPPDIDAAERLPLIVMLHGCGQDAQTLAASSGMNRVALQRRFLVIYPEQNAFLNPQRCWHWYDHRSGRARREALAIDAVIERACATEPVDRERIAIAGLSAGAAMAALLVMVDPRRFRALILHSGLHPLAANSISSALRVMRGRVVGDAPRTPDVGLPPLLLIHGDQDRTVHPDNAVELARSWSESSGAVPVAPRRSQRGTRHATTTTEFRAGNQIVATLREVHGLGHAWSGGARGHDFSDPKGPDASRLIWSFASKQFARRPGLNASTDATPKHPTGAGVHAGGGSPGGGNRLR